MSRLRGSGQARESTLRRASNRSQERAHAAVPETGPDETDTRDRARRMLFCRLAAVCIRTPANRCRSLARGQSYVQTEGGRAVARRGPRYEHIRAASVTHRGNEAFAA